ncbi:MAG TPA: tetratricopeptide repeat protein [Candidatus Binatia bacterium]|nr:tetratricopeptide repeat protein [Candidatus Binatia bacterium]
MRNAILPCIALLGLCVGALGGVATGQTRQDTAAMQSMTVAQLEKAGDECRAQKDYEQAIVYFREALRRESKNAKLYNKAGLAELSMGAYEGALADFGKTTKYDRRYPDGWNNLGVIYYVKRNYGTAVKNFRKAIALDPSRAVFHVNLGVAWFAQNDVNEAMREYTRALELDPEVLAHTSNAGISAQIISRDERAKHDFMMARIYARMGDVDSCLQCLRKARENGYTDLKDVYREEEFSRVREDPRLAEIVSPPAAK